MSEKRQHENVEPDVDDPVISLQDIIREDEELETTANAVLGGSDDQECTYPLGYVPRQALYACSTCSVGDDQVGVCLACSLECHDGHELFELYTKRDFRCDCGNSKCRDLTCKLCSDKDEMNVRNHYNHNFKGVYCTCNRPYPDPDDSVDDEMIQCVVCEDWFHGRHLLGTVVPPDSNYAEMVCHLCMKSRSDFLWFYNWEYTAPEKVHVDVVSVSPEKTKPQEVNATATGKSKETEQDSKSSDGIKQEKTSDSVVSVNDSNSNGTKAKTVKVQPTKPMKLEPESDENKTKCKLTTLKTKYSSSTFPEGASFWPDRWRETLCSCDECVKLMKDKNLSFLYNENDTVAEYEKKGADKPKYSSMDQGMQVLGGMNRIQQVEVIQGYNDMKAKLSEYLRSFADEGKVVTEEDIKAFFQRMSDQKRQRVVIPHMCK